MMHASPAMSSVVRQCAQTIRAFYIWKCNNALKTEIGSYAVGWNIRYHNMHMRRKISVMDR